MLTEEELARMGPEEIAEFQKRNCVFCQIAAGRIPARKVYEDEECVAVLDINPASKGHMLLMPREHYSVMPQVPEYTLEHIFMVCKGLSQAALRALRSRGTTIFAANGVAAGQKAPHFMVHVIPRYDGDGLPLAVPAKEVPAGETESIAAALKRALGHEGKLAEGAAAESKAKPKKKKTAARKEGSAKTGEGTKKKPEFDLDKIGEMLSHG